MKEHTTTNIRLLTTAPRFILQLRKKRNKLIGAKKKKNPKENKVSFFFFTILSIKH